MIFLRVDTIPYREYMPMNILSQRTGKVLLCCICTLCMYSTQGDYNVCVRYFVNVSVTLTPNLLHIYNLWHLLIRVLNSKTYFSHTRHTHNKMFFHFFLKNRLFYIHAPCWLLRCKPFASMRPPFHVRCVFRLRFC